MVGLPNLFFPSFFDSIVSLSYASLFCRAVYAKVDQSRIRPLSPPRTKIDELYSPPIGLEASSCESLQLNTSSKTPSASLYSNRR